MSIAYRIAPRGTGISEHPILSEGIDIGDGTRLMPGCEDEHWRAWTMGRVAEIMGRCAPWATTWCAPRISEGGDWWGGRCLPDCQILALATHPSAAFVVATAYHEIGHAADGYMLPGALAKLDEATAAIDWPGEYLASAGERHARFFEHVCAALDAGAALHIAPGSATETAWQLYTGEFARQRDAAISAAEAARVAAARPSRLARIRELCHV